MTMRAIAIAGCASVLALSTMSTPAQAYEDWGRHGPWTYEINYGCIMRAKVSDKVQASVALRIIGDEMLVTLSDERWPRDALKAMVEGQQYSATLAIDQGPSVVASARRDTRWGFITLTTHTDQFKRMSAGRSLRYQVGSSPVAGHFAIGLSAAAVEKRSECAAEASRRMDEADREWNEGSDD